jgi:hypothetical protein
VATTVVPSSPTVKADDESTGSSSEEKHRRESAEVESSRESKDKETEESLPETKRHREPPPSPVPGSSRKSADAGSSNEMGDKEVKEPSTREDRGTRDKENARTDGAKSELDKKPLEKLAVAGSKDPLPYELIIIPRAVTQLMNAAPEGTIRRYGVPATRSQLAAVRNRDEDFLHEGKCHLFRIPNRGTLNAQWTGLADGNHQVLLSYWNGSRFAYEDVRDVSRSKTFRISVSRPPSEKHLYILVTCTRGQVFTDAFVCLLAKSLDAASSSATPGQTAGMVPPASEDKAKTAKLDDGDSLKSGSVVQMPLAEQRPPPPRENERKAAVDSLPERQAALVKQAGKKQTSPEDRAAIARELYESGAAETTDLPRRFVLLNKAGEQAVLAGDGALALEVAEELTLQFSGEALKVKRDCLVNLASGYRFRASSEGHNEKRERERSAATAGPLMDFVEEAMGEREYDIAQRACKSAKDLGSESWDEKARERFAALSAAVDQAVAEQTAFKKAGASLKKKADDPEASWIAGRYLCLVLGKWDEGLAHLLLVDDENIRGAAKLELDSLSTPQQQILLAEKWRRAAQSHQGMDQEGMMLRAVVWYGWARSGLDEGPVRGKVDQSLQEMLQELARLAALPHFYPLNRVGYWNPKFVTQEWKTLHWDITPLVTLPGNYAIRFQCGTGADPLHVQWVVFGQDGKEISRRAQDSTVEGGQTGTQYTIALPTPEPGRKYGLYARVKSAGTASHGGVRLKYVGLTAPASPAPGTSAGKPSTP